MTYENGAAGTLTPDGATDTNTSESSVQRWRDCVDWWTDPGLAYVAGLQDGHAAGRADRDVEDDAVHREAVQAAVRLIEQANRRAAADRGELAA